MRRLAGLLLGGAVGLGLPLLGGLGVPAALACAAVLGCIGWMVASVPHAAPDPSASAASALGPGEDGDADGDGDGGGDGGSE
jgi:hypothetical protein